MDNNWTEIYNAYPVNKELIWLNNCGTTPASQFSVDKVSQFLNAYSKRGILADFEKLGNVRKSILNTLSSLLNCNPEELAIMHNTAEGINFISRGLSFKKGDEILLMENEYPSNVSLGALEGKGSIIKYYSCW